MGVVHRNMAAITKNLERALAGNNLEKMAETMSAFERGFENLDLQTQVRAQCARVRARACCCCCKGFVWLLCLCT